jgi:hypothetical protein
MNGKEREREMDGKGDRWVEKRWREMEMWLIERWDGKQRDGRVAMRVMNDKERDGWLREGVGQERERWIAKIERRVARRERDERQRGR